MKTKYFLGALFMAVSTFTQPVFAQDYELFGISPHGGETGSGAIYRFDENGNASLVTSLVRVEGQFPTGQLCKASNGKLYGMAIPGGKYSGGVLFEFDPVTGNYTKKFDFGGDENDNVFPSKPFGSLFQAKNGKLYGLSQQYTQNGSWVIFEFDLAMDKFTHMINLDSLEGSIFNGPLVQAGNGVFYGVTVDGGATGCGQMFEWRPEHSMPNLMDFNRTEHGSDMRGTLTVADNGKLYGLTRSGGVNDMGVLFEWDPSSQTFVKKIDFNGAEYGSNPVGTLVQSGNGKLYGVTYNGGLFGDGVLFEWDPYHDTFTKKFDFDSTEFGSHPFGSLVEMESGILVGMTYGSGTYSSGILFEWDPSVNSFIGKSELTDEFDDHIGKFNKGILSSLVQASNGKLYGVSPRGGFPTFYPAYTSNGFLFEWDPVLHAFSIKIKFQEAEYGSYPVKLVEGEDRMLYGIAQRGGIMNYGTMFQLDPVSGTLTKKYDFTGQNKGVYPRSLMMADNGRLYGSASYEPDVSPGDVFFEWDPATGLFSHPPVEGEPYSLLIQADNGKIYGTSYLQGASKPHATLFELDPTAHLANTKFEFYEEQNGSNPHLLVKARNGKLYGIADYKEGIYNKILFEWDPATDTYEKKLDIADTVHINSLFQASDDKFYGAVKWGKRGIFYEWDAETNAYTVKFEIEILQNSGTSFGSNMIQGDNGKLYGTIFEKSEAGYYIFEWDPAEDYIEKIADINWLQEKPITNLLYRKTDLSDLSSGTFNPNILLYPNPTAGEFSVDLGSVYPKADITITLPDGRVIRKDLILNGRYKALQMSEPPGVYVVVITIENERAVFKMVKK